MGYYLGIDVGASRVVAALARAESGEVVDVDLGDGDGGVAAVLHLGADGTLAVGDEAQRWARSEPDRVVRSFPGRIGDDDTMLLAGEPWAPEELTAWLVRWVVDRVAEREGGPAAAIGVTHPGSWDAARIALLVAALAEQDMDVTFLTPTAEEAGDGDEPADAAARRAATVLQAAAAVPQVDGAGGSGRHVAVGLAPAGQPVDGAGGSGRHLAVGGAPAERPVDGAGGSGHHPVVGGAIAALAGHLAANRSVPAVVDSPGSDTDTDPPADDATDAGPQPADDGSADAAGLVPDQRDDDRAGSAADPEDGDGEPRDGGWDVPAPRSHDSGGYPADPATTNLVADLVGFTGGMGATNTAGLLSGYTPPQGMPASWSGAPAAAPVGTATASGAVALPAQRSESGRWPAATAEDAPDEHEEAAAPAVRARDNPSVLVSVGGVAAAVAVVATLFLWPAPRTTNSATSRAVPIVPVATASVAPSATESVAPTVEPTPTPRPRATPRPRRPEVVPTPGTVASETTPFPTASTEPTETTTPLSEETEPPSTEPEDDDDD